MRHLIFIVALIAFANIVFAQYTIDREKFENSKSRSMLKTNPFIMLWGPIPYSSEFRLMYEAPVGRQQSLLVGASYLGKSPFMSAYERMIDTSSSSTIRYTVKGFRFQLAYKFYFLSVDAKYRFYFAPYFSGSWARISTRSLNNTNIYTEASYINYNIIIGYQTPLFTERLDFDLYVGAGYKQNKWSQVYNQKTTVLDDDGMYMLRGPLKVVLGFNIGYVIK